MKKIVLLVLLPFSFKAQSKIEGQNLDTVFIKNGDYVAGKIDYYDGKNYYFKNVVSNSLTTVSKHGGGLSDNINWYLPFSVIDRVKDYRD